VKILGGVEEANGRGKKYVLTWKKDMNERSIGKMGLGWWGGGGGGPWGGKKKKKETSGSQRRSFRKIIPKVGNGISRWHGEDKKKAQPGVDILCDKASYEAESGYNLYLVRESKKREKREGF